LKCESLVTEPAAAVEKDTENCENAPANHQSQPIADLSVPAAAETRPETLVEEQPFVPPSRPKKRSLCDSDSCSTSVLSRSFSSEDELGRRKKSKRYNYKCGEKDCSFTLDDKKEMSEHLDWHMQMLTSCGSCQVKHRGPVDAQIHRFVFEKHTKESWITMTKRVVIEKKKKQGEIMCNLEFDGAGYGSYSYSTLITTTNEFTPFVDMTLKNASVKPTDWQSKVCRNRAWKKPKISNKE
jgi:hypothetical protein